MDAIELGKHAREILQHARPLERHHDGARRDCRQDWLDVQLQSNTTEEGQQHGGRPSADSKLQAGGGGGEGGGRCVSRMERGAQAQVRVGWSHRGGRKGEGAGDRLTFVAVFWKEDGRQSSAGGRRGGLCRPSPLSPVFHTHACGATWRRPRTATTTEQHYRGALWPLPPFPSIAFLTSS